MKRAQAIRISILLVAIFAAGVLTGRLTARRLPTLVATPFGTFQTADSVLSKVTAELELDAKQQEQLRPLFEEMAEKMVKLPPASNERREVFRSYAPRIRAMLPPDQQSRFDRHVEMTEKRFERMIRRRAAGTPP